MEKTTLKTINLPVEYEDIRGLRAGDIICLSGTLVTGRDEVHHRVIEEGIAPPVDLKGMAIYHAGPIVKETGDGISSYQSQVPNLNSPLPTPHSPFSSCELVSIGPTSSIRMEKWAAQFIKRTGVKIMIGKGGMGEKTREACKEYGALHCVYPGGCAVLGASQIEKIDGVFWNDLGMAECLWVMTAHRFGPLIVSIDAQGNNLFLENSLYYKSKL